MFNSLNTPDYNGKKSEGNLNNILINLTLSNVVIYTQISTIL